MGREELITSVMIDKKSYKNLLPVFIFRQGKIYGRSLSYGKNINTAKSKKRVKFISFFTGQHTNTGFFTLCVKRKFGLPSAGFITVKPVITTPLPHILFQCLLQVLFHFFFEK